MKPTKICANLWRTASRKHFECIHMHTEFKGIVYIKNKHSVIIYLTSRCSKPLRHPLSLCGIENHSHSLNILPNYFCFPEENKSYRFGTAWGWVNDDRIVICGWTVLRNMNLQTTSILKLNVNNMKKISVNNHKCVHTGCIWMHNASWRAEDNERGRVRKLSRQMSEWVYHAQNRH